MLLDKVNRDAAVSGPLSPAFLHEINQVPVLSAVCSTPAAQLSDGCPIITGPTLAIITAAVAK